MGALDARANLAGLVMDGGDLQVRGVAQTTGTRVGAWKVHDSFAGFRVACKPSYLLRPCGAEYRSVPGAAKLQPCLCNAPPACPRPQAAERLLRTNLALTESVFGRDHPSSATALNNLALCLKVAHTSSCAPGARRRRFVVLARAAEH